MKDLVCHAKESVFTLTNVCILFTGWVVTINVPLLDLHFRKTIVDDTLSVNQGVRAFDGLQAEPGDSAISE